MDIVVDVILKVCLFSAVTGIIGLCIFSIFCFLIEDFKNSEKHEAKEDKDSDRYND